MQIKLNENDNKKIEPRVINMNMKHINYKSYKIAKLKNMKTTTKKIPQSTEIIT